jgi:hypothetical protein
MPSEHGFGDDGTKATRFYKPDDGDDQMKEKARMSYILQGLRCPVSHLRRSESFLPRL